MKLNLSRLRKIVKKTVSEHKEKAAKRRVFNKSVEAAVTKARQEAFKKEAVRVAKKAGRVEARQRFNIKATPSSAYKIPPQFDLLGFRKELPSRKKKKGKGGAGNIPSDIWGI